LFSDPSILRKEIVAAVADVSSITLRVLGIGCTPDYFKTLFIEFEENQLLSRIHHRLEERFSDVFHYELVPHLSLLYADLPFKEKEALARRTQVDRDKISFDEVRIVSPLNRVQGWRDTVLWQTICRTKLAGNRTVQGLRAVILDFGGVIATEGFREGLYAIARHHGLDPMELLQVGMDAIYDSGYISGRAGEAEFWATMRKQAGLAGTDAELSSEILTRFAVRPRMLEAVQWLRRKGIITVILSDQTDWLERLDERDDFYRMFDHVFNSYRLGKGKRDPGIFTDVAALLDIAPWEALFVDDMPANVERSRSKGMRGLVFKNEDEFLAELDRLFG
jgi:putative hydrolase of the HAD superfamily